MKGAGPEEQFASQQAACAASQTGCLVVTAEALARAQEHSQH